MIVKRYLEAQILKDLSKKMVFLSGPRQVGKTTFSKQILQNIKGYLSWDIAEHREKILKRELPDTDMLVFDEIHKYRHWRNYLKGLYDNLGDKIKILVTGSARLDYYRYGGDSLQGRYHFFRMHPFSIAELGDNLDDFDRLLDYGGFPEPFLSDSKIEVKRWSREYRSRLINEDIRDLERINDLGNLELLYLRLPELVGSPLSINSIREDLQVSHKTVSNWLDILERLYAIFRLSPFGSPEIRAVKKEQKHYHYDWTLIKDKGMRLENMVAVHLLKYVHYLQDAEGRDINLKYFRDIDKREVDFVIVEDNKPKSLIELKLSEKPISKSLIYLKKKFPNCEALQISAYGKKEYINPEGIRVMPCLKYLKTLV